jgi:D-sedoheptulose 7-phosphate isomerase
MDYIDTYLNEEAQLLALLAREPLQRLAAILRQARNDGRTIFMFGNGGSAATASHFVVDIIKGTRGINRPRFKIIGLNDNVPTLTALGNDLGYEHTFSEPLASLGQPGDIAIAISGSGNSPNVLRAMQVARERQMITVALTGATGGKLKDMVELAVLVPSPSMQMVEDTHLVVLHAIFVELCRE